MNKNQFSPQTHIFLWDLHDVILKKSLWSWFMVCLRFDRKWQLIRHLDKKTISILCTFLLERFGIIKKQMVSEELIIAAEKAHNQALIDLTIQACSSYTPIKKTVLILQELSRLGYEQHLGSNIGQTVFDDCYDKFPTVFSLFKHYTILFMVPHSFKIIKKPQAEFFYTHLAKHNLTPEQVIFIDDKITNVQAAQALGIHGIHFKNAHDLRQQLIAYHIL